MAMNQTNKLVWIVETIYKARKITFEELNRRWMDNVDLSGGEDIEVLEPLWLRREIAGKIKRMWNKYNKEEIL